jgi:hypothetical protein
MSIIFIKFRDWKERGGNGILCGSFPKRFLLLKKYEVYDSIAY